VRDPFRNELFELMGGLRLFLAATAPGQVKGGKLAHWAEDAHPDAPGDFLSVIDRTRTVVADFDADLGELDYLARRTAAMDMQSARDSVEYWRLTRDQARAEARDWRYGGRDSRRRARIYAKRADIPLRRG
jgi:hypothetical protein